MKISTLLHETRCVTIEVMEFLFWCVRSCSLIVTSSSRNNSWLCWGHDTVLNFGTGSRRNFIILCRKFVKHGHLISSWLTMKTGFQVVTRVVAAVWRHFTGFCLCSLYRDVKKGKSIKFWGWNCMGVFPLFCVLHVVQLNISGVRVSFFQVTLFLQVPLWSQVIQNIPLCAHFAVHSLFCVAYVLMFTSLNNYIDVVGCNNRMVRFSYCCFDELSWM
jgi:hypothetical protein